MLEKDNSTAIIFLVIALLAIMISISLTILVKQMNNEYLLNII